MHQVPLSYPAAMSCWAPQGFADTELPPACKTSMMGIMHLQKVQGALGHQDKFTVMAEGCGAICTKAHQGVPHQYGGFTLG